MMKDVMIVTGTGQISMAIARRIGFGMKIVMGDKNLKNAETIAKIMNDAGFDVVPMETDISDRGSILNLIIEARKYGAITKLVNGAGVSPSQAPIEAILKVDLYGTAVLLEEVGKVIAEGGTGVTISSQSGWRMPALTAEGMEKGRELLELLNILAAEKNATPAQISLAWMLGKKDYIIPIPGSRKVERLRENLGSVDVELTPEEISDIDKRLDGMDFLVFGGHAATK